ncbi:beta-1,4-glucuronyltransferase 1 [Hyalella azteca]|uniref:Beta-1,4-glucuronyltransferase 1 n=1 Tax=Hyalella azteca TaxID=294128 RepID=A0A8B7P706_HYAAZ|nr:beta-1,4-glucuronyltransferase 1 [Hyalella azteca]
MQWLNMALFRSRLMQVSLLTNACLIAYLSLEQFFVHESCSQIFTLSPSHHHWNEANSGIQLPRNTAPYYFEQTEFSQQVSRPRDDTTVNSNKVQIKQEVTEHLHASGISNGAPDPPPLSLEKKMFPDFRGCASRPSLPIQSQHGEYWILENYIPADLSFRCDESITYTTHGDYTHLDNIETITSRWQGPVSIGLYAPGGDFNITTSSIMYLRDCRTESIRKYVTFHLIYHTDHIPEKIPTTEELMGQKMNCSVDPPNWMNVTSYRRQKGLVYPINVARNVARRMATTYFVFPSDIELYPSVNFIPEFLEMLKKPDVSNTTQPRVYVFPIFEVEESSLPPKTKEELIKMLDSKHAIPFHERVCKPCHNIPHSEEWRVATVKPGLSVLNVSRREGAFKHWEPFYVGTHREPLHDERLSWEGKSNKMTQAYILCVRGYEFHILDNAFLVHRPGIKKYHRYDASREAIVAKQTRLLKGHILPEYKVLFGTKSECVL